MTHLADTVVVKDTQSLTKESGVVPVMSSHCAGEGPPTSSERVHNDYAHTVQAQHIAETPQISTSY